MPETKKADAKEKADQTKRGDIANRIRLATGLPPKDKDAEYLSLVELYHISQHLKS